MRLYIVAAAIAAATTTAAAQGPTSELGVGAGILTANDRVESEGLLLDGYLGGWVGQHVTFGARLTMLATPNADYGVFGTGLLGPAVQLWITDACSIGLGAGLGFLVVPGGGEAGHAVDLRVGYALSSNEHRTLSLSVVTTYVGLRNDTLTNVSLMFSYQMR